MGGNRGVYEKIMKNFAVRGSTKNFEHREGGLRIFLAEGGGV